jgi:hypothetical protein
MATVCAAERGAAYPLFAICGVQPYAAGKIVPNHNGGARVGVLIYVTEDDFLGVL